jgi:hypothetical protein
MTIYAIQAHVPSMGWTEDPTVLGNGCDNRWPSEAEALAACDELAQGLGVFRDALRVVPINPENYKDSSCPLCGSLHERQVSANLSSNLIEESHRSPDCLTRDLLQRAAARLVNYGIPSATPAPVYTLPTIHPNGTGAKSLADEYHAVYQAIDRASDALAAATCNARDFYPQEPGAYARAMSQRFEAFRKLREVQAYAQAWMEAAGDHL